MWRGHLGKSAKKTAIHINGRFIWSHTIMRTCRHGWKKCISNCMRVMRTQTERWQSHRTKWPKLVGVNSKLWLKYIFMIQTNGPSHSITFWNCFNRQSLREKFQVKTPKKDSFPNRTKRSYFRNQRNTCNNASTISNQLLTAHTHTIRIVSKFLFDFHSIFFIFLSILNHWFFSLF